MQQNSLSQNLNPGSATLSSQLGDEITEKKKAEQAAQEDLELLQGQNQVLKLIAQGAPLETTLDTLLRIVEHQVPGMLASILLLDSDGRHVRHGAAPSLPEGYIRYIDGSSIGPCAGSCGTAAYRGEPVIVEDIATDPLWADYRSVALAHGLRACWSTPIFDEQHRVLGTFALYFRTPGRPDDRHLKQIAMVTHTASIAIVKHRERAALAAAEQRLRLALDAGKVGIWERDIESNRLVWSAQLKRIVGRPVEEDIPFERLLELVHPDDRARVAAAALQAQSKPMEADVEFRIIWPDGSVHWIAARGRTECSTDGQPLFVRGVGLDITQRKQMEEELRVRETQLADAQRAANFGSYEWLPDTNTVRWTDELFRIFGFEPAEFQPTVETYLERVHPEDREATRKRIEECVRNHTAFEAEERILRRDGEVRLLASQARWLFDENRQVKKLVGTCQDITARRETELSRLRLEAELRQMHKMESIGRLAGGVAHDFNNLLGVIMGHLSLCQDRLSPESPLYENIKQIEQAARRGANLTRHLLAFSRRQVICPAVLDLNTVVNNLNTMINRVIGEHIALRIVPGQSLGRVRADLGQIDQILMNLLVNAVDAMPKGGEIVIRTGNVKLPDDSRVLGSSVEAGPYVMLSVTDTGCGMDSTTTSQIFEPFFTTKGPGEGTGLGLSMVYGAVKQNNGHITVTSQVGKGSTFTVFFPRVEQAPEPAPARTAEAYRRGSETILLVEDDAALRDTTAALLEAQGYKVLAARNSSAGLVLAKGYPGKIDLLLTDVVMAEMSGPDLAVQIKAHRPDLGVLYTSGYTGTLLSHHGLPDADTALLPKPFTKEDLLSRINDVLASKTKS
ncbi:MAG TPA: PAS domain-containing protein [Terriglobales bacterium]|jgi:two-component system cell cycle sensor histidine kinase/response regulator CckA|nr:PAS domain-containing protein [Terriglobales bacterium]